MGMVYVGNFTFAMKLPDNLRQCGSLAKWSQKMLGIRMESRVLQLKADAGWLYAGNYYIRMLLQMLSE